MLLPIVRSFIEKHNLINPHDQLVIGVSGGADSLTLLHLLTRLRAEWDLHLCVAHLNHTLRPTAAADSAFVAALCAEWQVPCEVAQVDVVALARTQKLSVEEAGRRARYDFFARLGKMVAVAHNADDQTETVLMHFLRGSGVGGLRGMLPKTITTQQTVIRPLLNITRNQIEGYCAEHKLEPRVDETNSDTAYLRNRLRHELLPTLESYNPQVRQILRRTAQVAAGDYELVREVVAQAWAKLAQADAEFVVFDLAQWRKQSVALQRALLRAAVQHLRRDLRDVDFVPIENAVRWLSTAASGQTADLLAGLCVRVSGSLLKICAWTEFSPTYHEARLEVGEEVLFGNWRLTATPLEKWGLDQIAANENQKCAYMPASFAPFIVRTRRAGDRFAPLGMNGKTMKLSDFMINQKIPLDERERVPLVTIGETVLWVCGYRTAHEARVLPETGEVVKLEIF